VLRNKQRGDDESTARQAATLAKGAAAAGNWRRRVTMVDARDLEFLAGVERPRRLRAEEKVQLNDPAVEDPAVQLNDPDPRPAVKRFLRGVLVRN
jgi:hypothetical protein